jgi:polyhydroxyalkanoate synthesis regulator phasin
MSGIFENRNRVGNVGSDIVRRDLDTSGQDALLNTLEGKQAKSETDGLERQMLLSKPQLASKIRKYQNETDVNNPNYVQGYTDIVRDHYSTFKTSTTNGMKYVRRNEMAVKESYQAAGINYQVSALKRQDNENVRNYINETLTTIQQDGFIKTGAVSDIKKIIDLSENIPNTLKPALKKNAINEIYIEDVRTKMANGANAEDITNTLESYRGKIDPAKYRTLSRGVKVYKMNLLAQEQRNTNRLTAEFKKKLDGYRDCIGTGNCAGSEGNLPDMINSSELPNDYKKALMTRFDDIDELSEMFAEVDNNLMGSVGAVDAYIKKNPDNNKNNARRNKMLKEYINRRTNEYDDDPVGFLLKHDDEIKELNEKLSNLPEIQRESAEGELRKAINQQTGRSMTNAEIVKVSKIDDYKEKADSIKKLIEMRGEEVIDELVDKGALSDDFIAISNFSEDVPLQYKAFRLLQDEKEIKSLSRNSDISYATVEEELKASGEFADFIDSIRGRQDGERYANSIVKLTVLESLKTGNTDSEPVVKTFKTMMGDSWVYEKTLLPKTITEGIASDRFENIKDADYLTKKLKKAGSFYYNTVSTDKRIDDDSFASLAESVESEEVKFEIRDNTVSFVKDGMFVLKKDGSLYTVPFDEFDLVAKPQRKRGGSIVEKPTNTKTRKKRTRGNTGAPKR